MTGALVWERDDVRVIDTRALPWEDFPGIPGGRTKVLSRDADGHAAVMLNWLPPTLAVPEPERHAHRTVVEHGYVLAGELPIREYAGPEDHTGQRVVFRPGFFYGRRPGSVHGLDPDGLGTGIGFLILEWRSGPGTYLWEEGVERETTSVPLSPTGEARVLEAEPDTGVVLDREDVTILDTRAMTWAEHPGARGGRIRVLERNADGVPVVMVNWLPSRPVDGPGERHLHRTVAERGFVLGGEWPHREYEDRDDEDGHGVLFRAGFFYERAPGSVHGLDPRRSGLSVGVEILEWRSGPGTYLHEEGAAGETESLPFA